MRPRRILYIEVNEDGTVGGSHQALYDLVRNLDRSRYEPVVLFYEDNRFATLLREEGFETYTFDDVRAGERRLQRTGSWVAKRLGVAKTILQRRRFLKEHRMDAVHINNNPRVGSDDWLPACRLLRIPIVATVMGDAGDVPRWVHRWLMRQFDMILPISEGMTESITGRGVPREILMQVHLGVDIEEIRDRVTRDTAAVRSELGLSDGQLLLTMAGNIREWKGQDVLLKALGMLTGEEKKRFHVAFAGAIDGESEHYWERLQKLVGELELGGNISWLGFRQDVPDLFAAADLAVHCSTEPEPFGLVVVEAMALGTPVTATNFGGPAEIVDSSSGWLYDAAKPEELADILRSVLADPGLLSERGAGALERAEEFSVTRNVAGNVAAYSRIFRD